MSHTIVMTGATRGIGRVAAENTLERDPDAALVLLSRAPGGTRLSDEWVAQGRTAVCIPTDLTSMDSVRAASAELVRMIDEGSLPPPTLFMANAGLQHTDDLTETTEGFEATFAVNVLANHVLVRALEKRLTAPARIVITVSDTHFGDLRHNMGMVPGPVWQPAETLARTGAFPKPHSVTAGRRAYSTSKLATIHLVHEYARRLPPDVDVVSFNPGFVPGTDLARNAGLVSRFAMRRLMPLMALTPMATDKETAGRWLADAVLGETPASTGSYIDRGAVARSSPESYDPTRERELWDAVERLLR